MKISKKTLLVIGIGVFIIVVAGLFMAYSGKAAEQKELNKTLADRQQRLQQVQPKQLSSQQAELESQLNQATAQFEVVKKVLAQPLGSVAITNAMFDIAKAYGLEVTVMSSASPTTESLEGVTCSVIVLTAKVEGDVNKLTGFITKLNSYLTTAVVELITITIPEADSGEKPSADIQLVAFYWLALLIKVDLVAVSHG